MSRYTGVTEGVIEVCQRDYAAGHQDVGHSIPDLGPTKATLIAIQSLAADALIESHLLVLMGKPLGSLDDWSLAVLAEIFLTLVKEIKDEATVRPEDVKWMEQRAWDALEQALDSPTASPMLWYEGIFFELAERYRLEGDPRAIALLKRGLAHSLRYEKGGNATTFLRDLAEAHLWLGDLERGLEILTGLLRNDPTDIWVYNTAGYVLGHVGLVELGIEAIQRGLEVIAATGDPERLHRQFLNCLNDLRENASQGQQAALEPATLAAFRAALALDPGAGLGLPVAKLCRELVADLDQVPVKEPLELVAQAPQPKQQPSPQPRRPVRRKRKKRR